MANEKVWTPQQLNAAAESLTMRQELSCGVQFQKIGGYRYETWAVDLQCELTAKDAELAVASELLSIMYHDMGHLMITPEWQHRRREFLKRNTGGQ